MSGKEVPRAGLLKAAGAGQITNAEAALALHLTVRDVAHLVRDGRVDRLILAPEEAAWLQARWSAADA